MRKNRIIAVSVIVVVVFVGFICFDVKKEWFLSDSLKNLWASVFFTDSITTPGLRAKYKNVSSEGDKVRILIVPGHEPDYGGAEYGNLKERDMNVDLALSLKKLLEADSHYEVFISRDKKDWDINIKKFLEDKKEEISQFTLSKKAEMRQLMSEGKIVKLKNGPYHVSAKKDVAMRLFGINKWANENKMDILIHIHLNDYPRSKSGSQGKYRGFAVYVPEKQYSNARASLEAGKYIFNRLNNFYPVSTQPKEEGGIVPDQDLIALGEGNTVDGISVLLEYAYIYEPLFDNQSDTKNNFEIMAKQTYWGLTDFLSAM